MLLGNVETDPDKVIVSLPPELEELEELELEELELEVLELDELELVLDELVFPLELPPPPPPPPHPLKAIADMAINNNKVLKKRFFTKGLEAVVCIFSSVLHIEISITCDQKNRPKAALKQYRQAPSIDLNTSFLRKN